jgi:16S rRNA (guanine966-N2)-methyltransferase
MMRVARNATSQPAATAFRAIPGAALMPTASTPATGLAGHVSCSGIMATVVRIVAGVARGRRLAVPPHGTRPTSDRVREAVFSALAARRDLDGARVLDLYAGSGALGLEALSRGAAHVQFVESDRRAATVLYRNIEVLGLGGGDGTAATVTIADVLAMLRTNPVEAYDVVLADPPYALDGGTLDGVLSALAGGGWLAPAALVVVERPAKALPPNWPDGVSALTQRRYGDTAVYYGCAP